MTEFQLGEDCVLGLMPAAGIRRLLGQVLLDPDLGTGIRRVELYLIHPDAANMHLRAVLAGATELSPMMARNWGDVVGYCMDTDGHVIACALPTALTR